MASSQCEHMLRCQSSERFEQFMGGCAICSRLRGRHAGEGGEAAARSFEEFMESTFPRGLDSTGLLVSPH